MIPYAGHEGRFSFKDVSRSYRAHMMFRAGKDTAFIADHFKLPEAGILRWINEERSRELGEANPYGRQA